MNPKQFSWNYIKQFNKNPPKIGLARHPVIQKNYDIWREINMGQMDENLTNRYFNNNSNIYKYTINDFPYNVRDNIQHNILWFNPYLTKNKNNFHIFVNDKIVNEILKKDVKNSKPYIYFRNIPKNSSIHDIIHYHVFVKKW